MATTITTTVGSAHTDTTVQAWINTLNGLTLASADQIQEGACYHDSEFVVAGAVASFASVSYSGDATRYAILDCGAGQSFRDNASVRTNALYYNAANGVALRNTGASLYTIDSHTQPDFWLSGLQIAGDAGTRATLYVANAGGAGEVDNCIVIGGELELSGPMTFNNCLFVNTLVPFARIIETQTTDTMNFRYCTFIATTSISYYVQFDAAATLNFTNCCFFGGGTTSFANGTGTLNFTNCMTDAASGTGLTGGVAFSTSSGAMFQSVTNDFRVKTGSTLDNGTANPVSGITTDISGFTRKAHPTIGCWEVAPAVAAHLRERVIAWPVGIHP